MKKLFLILLILPIGLLADDWIFSVENTTMVTAYFNIFNAIAALFKNDSYIDLLRLAFLVGGFFVFAKGVLAAWEGSASANMLSPYGKYLAIGVALLTLIFSRTSTLWIEAKELPTYCPGAPTGTPSTTAFAVELPSVLAYVFKVTNTIGTELTYLAEAAFTNPSNPAGSAAMSDSDGYLGSLKATIGLLNINPSYVTLSKDDALTAEKATDFVQDFRMFYQSCITENNQNQGEEGRDQDYKIMKSDKIVETIDAYIGSDSPDTGFQFSSGKYPGNVYTNIYGVPKTCRAVWANLKSTEGAIAKFAAKMCSVHPKINGGVFELITGTHGTGAALEMTGIGLQAGLINAIKASNKYDSIGIQGGGSFTAGESRAATNLDQLSTASYMAEMIPYLQMTMRAVLYAFFPFVFVVVLLPGGLTVLTQYLQTMIWIELWTPTAAIVNMFINLRVKDTVGAEYSREGLTLMTSANMLSEANTIAGVGAVLYLSIPPLTWLILKGSGQMLGGMLSSHSAGFAKNLNENKRGEDVRLSESGRVQNNERASKQMSAISYGERAHYESLREGNQVAGSIMSSMESGLQSEKSAAYQKTGEALETALKNKESAGSDKNVVDNKSTTNTLKYASDQALVKELGLNNSDGSMNKDNVDKYADTTAADNRNKYNELEAEQKLRNKGIGEGGREGSEKDANLKAREQNTKLGTDEDLQNQFSDKFRSKTDANERATKILADSKFQEKYENNDRATQDFLTKTNAIEIAKSQFGNSYKSAANQGNITGEQNLTNNEIEAKYQELQDHQRRVLAGAFDKSSSAEKNMQMIKELGGGDLDKAADRAGYANARQMLVGIAGQEYADKHYNWNKDGSLKGFSDVVNTSAAEKTEQHIPNPKDLGNVKGMTEAGNYEKNKRQQEQTSEQAIREMSKVDNFKTLQNVSVEKSLENNQEYQKLLKTKENFDSYTPNFKRKAVEDDIKSIELGTLANNTLSIMEIMPTGEDTIQHIKSQFKGTELEESFNQMIASNNMEKGNIDNFNSDDFYKMGNYLSGGKSDILNDFNGNTVTSLNTNALDQVTQISAARLQGYKSESNTNAAGTYELVANDQLSNTAVLLTNTGADLGKKIIDMSITKSIFKK